MPDAVVRCLVRQELPLLDDVKVSLYRVVRSLSFEAFEKGMDYIQQTEVDDLTGFDYVRELCKGSDAAGVTMDSLSFFMHLRKSPPSHVQLLTVPSLVKSLQILKVLEGDVAHEGSEHRQQSGDALEVAGFRLVPETIKLEGDLIAYDSSIDGIPSHSFLALKVVGEGVERVITRDELIARASRFKSRASPSTSVKTQRRARKIRRRRRGGRKGRGRDVRAKPGRTGRKGGRNGRKRGGSGTSSRGSKK